MELSLFEKMKIIFELLFSSFMFIELFFLFLLLFFLVVVNMKVKNKVIPIFLTIFFAISVLVLVIYHFSYVATCLDTFIMKVMDYYYFPSTVVFFFLFILAIFIFIYTIFSKRLLTWKKIFNYGIMTVIFLLFSMFIGVASIHHIDLSDVVSLYQNDQILSVVQLSNLIFLCWILVSFFYHLYMFFRKKFDKEKVES